MKRCPNGTRRNKNGDCVKKTDKDTSVKRCPKGTRRNKNGDCVKKTDKDTSVKRCPNGTHRNKKGDCVKKLKSKLNEDQTTEKNKPLIKMSSKKSSSQKNKFEYIVTVHNSNGTQIVDMDYSVDRPLDLINEAEWQLKTNNYILPLADKYISTYEKLMNKSNIDDDELASLWYCQTDKNFSGSHNVNYKNKVYVLKFHPI
jgi:hypothetical protein